MPPRPAPTAPAAGSRVIRVQGLSNAAFLKQYARPGCIGLASGLTLIDKAICLAERHLDEKRRWGQWSHAFIFEGERLDGHMWVIESDLQVLSKHIQLGAQENRTSKYNDEAYYTNLAVLDFGLTPEQTTAVLGAGLELVADHSRFSIRECLGAWMALRHQERRDTANVLARDHSYYCSAFVLHLFRSAGLDLLPGIEEKRSAPEELLHSPVPHTCHLLVRQKVTSAVVRAIRKMRVGLRRGLRTPPAATTPQA